MTDQEKSTLQDIKNQLVDGRLTLINIERSGKGSIEEVTQKMANCILNIACLLEIVPLPIPNKFPAPK